MTEKNLTSIKALSEMELNEAIRIIGLELCLTSLDDNNIESVNEIFYHQLKSALSRAYLVGELNGIKQTKKLDKTKSLYRCYAIYKNGVRKFFSEHYYTPKEIDSSKIEIVESCFEFSHLLNYAKRERAKEVEITKMDMESGKEERYFSYCFSY